MFCTCPHSWVRPCFSWSRRASPLALGVCRGTLQATPTSGCGGIVAGCSAYPRLTSEPVLAAPASLQAEMKGDAMGRLNKWSLFRYVLSRYKILQQFSIPSGEREKHNEVEVWWLNLWLNTGGKLMVGLMFFNLDLWYYTSVAVGSYSSLVISGLSFS